NQIAEYAREHHVGTAVWANLKTLPGYLLLTVVYTLFSYPLCRRSRALVSRRRFRGTLRVLLVNLLLFVLSLGLSAAGNPGFIDALARHLSPVFPAVNWYALYEWHVVEVLLTLLALMTAFVGWSYAGALRSRGRRAALASLTACVPLLVVPADAPPTTDRLNILIIGSDSLRADHLSCYDYERGTSTAHIDRIAREGIVFENMQVATASTLESWTSILSAQFPVTHGLRYMFPNKERVQAVSSNPDLLPRVLGRAGYDTIVSSDWAGNCFRLVDMGFARNHASDVQNLNVFVAEATLMSHLIFPLYFNNRLGEVLYPEIRQITAYLNPPVLVDRLSRELDHSVSNGRPFLGVLFTSTTHLPYAARYPYSRKWVDPGYRGPNRYQIDFEVDSFMAAGFTDALSPTERQHIVDLYDGTVSEFDTIVGSALALLEDRGLLDRTIVIIMSDHGDDLYEPGTTLGHGTNFFGGDQTTRIPFIVRLPGAAHAGTRVRDVVRNVDIAPTLLDFLDHKSPESYEGVSLKPAMEAPETDLELPGFSETCYLFFPKKAHGEDALVAKTGAGYALAIDPDFRNNFVLKERYHDDVIKT
ncbi:MAG: sulfatase, partial [Planctomycetes bacterium]|nr:sulfatase [Planctomycetota bacterium]